MIIELSWAEVAAAQRIAAAKRAFVEAGTIAHRASYATRRVDEERAQDEAGAAGELAVCQHLFGPLATDRLALFETQRRNGLGDGGTDLRIHGLRVQVKTTARRPGLWLPPDFDWASCDILVAAHRIGDRTIRLLGWLPILEAHHRARKTPTRYGERFWIPSRALRPPHSMAAGIQDGRTLALGRAYLRAIGAL